MLLKCCTQYTSKFGKLSSGHRTRKYQFSFQSHREAMPKNVQTTVQLGSFHMLARLCSKSFKLSFSSVWTENLQMDKLGFEEEEEPEIKLPTIFGSWRKQGSSRKKTSTFASLTTLKALTIWITADHGKFLKRWEWPNHLTCLLRSLYAGQEETVRTGHGTMDIWTMVQNWERSKTRLCTVERLLMNHAKMLGFSASRGEEFNPEPETRLGRSELLCNKVLLKYKGDRESFWHRHQKGVERVPSC